jgi:hypothetical protein
VKRRGCQFCKDPLPWWAPLVGVVTCPDCSYRRAHGGGPMTPEGRARIKKAEAEAERDPVWRERQVDEVWAAKQALAHPGRYYGEGGTLHGTTELDVETDATGRVVAVWYRCQMLPFKQHTVSDQRAIDMDEGGAVPLQITGVEVLDL